MSMQRRARRRRRGRRSSVLAGDATDLFLDAITNTLGVVMFVLLMVVLFGRAEPEPREPNSPLAAEVRQLREERDHLAAQVAALPPAGDPELVQRWREAMQAIAERQPELDRLQRELVQRTEAVAAAEQLLAHDREALRELQARVAQVVQRARQASTDLVRVSRFRQDARTPVLMAVSRGALSLLRITADTAEVAPPSAGEAVPDAAAAALAVRALLAGTAPATHRVELAVWADSFGAAKLVEAALIEAGYDTNPLPIAAGQSLKAGTGGVQ